MAHIETVKVIAAAAAAFRINGNKIIKEPTEGIMTNRVLVDAALSSTHPELITITQDDIDMATTIIDGLQHRQVLVQLKGGKISDFMNQILKLIQEPTMPSRLVGIAMWAPKTYNDLQKADDVQHELTVLSFGSQYLGKEKDKITIDFVTITERFNKEFGCWRYTGHDTKGNLVGFLSKTKLLSVKTQVRGRIKATEQGKFTGGRTTYLNYVKEIK